MAEQKNYVTFMNVVEGKGKNGDYKFAVARGTVSRFQERKVHEGTSEEKTIVTASMPVNGRSKLINSQLGTNYADNDTVWLNVTFWSNADRILNFLKKSGNPDRVQMILTGALSKNEYQKADGAKGMNVRLMAGDFNVISTPNAASGSSADSSTPASQESNTSSDIPPAVGPDDFDEDGFADIDGSEDDLPF